MSILRARWVFPVSCAIVLLTVAACEFGIEPRQETDAELYCRQGGLDWSSTAYDDCVETFSEGVAPPPADQEAETSKQVTIVSRELPEPVIIVSPEFPEQPTFAIHLSSLRSKIGTETEWKKLQKRFPDLLGDRELMVRSVELEGQGTFFRVLTGPFAVYAKAQQLCATFKSREQYCLAAPASLTSP